MFSMNAYDGSALTDDSIKQSRLAHIGTTDDGDYGHDEVNPLLL